MTMCLAVAIVLLLVTFYMNIRIVNVHMERQAILGGIHDRAKRCLRSGEDWEWLYDAYESGPSFDQMLFTVWRPVRSFFPPVGEWRQ